MPRYDAHMNDQKYKVRQNRSRLRRGSNQVINTKLTFNVNTMERVLQRICFRSQEDNINI